MRKKHEITNDDKEIHPSDVIERQCVHQADPESSHQSPDTLECIDLTEDEVAAAHARDLPRPRHGSAASVADTLSIKTEFEDPDTEGRSRRRRSEEAGLGGMGQYSSQESP